MCVGIPGKIIAFKEKKAKIKQGNHSHWIDVSSLTDEVEEGDYVTVYQNVALNKIAEEEVKKILELMDSASDTGIKSSD